MLLRDGRLSKARNHFTHIPSHGQTQHPGATKLPIVYARFTVERQGGLILLKTQVRGIATADSLAQILRKRCGPNPTAADEIAVKPVPPEDPHSPPDLADSDIPVCEASCVVIELSPDLKWQFRSGNVGVTTKELFGQSNYDLWHINQDGVPSQDQPTKNLCRLAHFDVLEREGKSSRQGFNLHVELYQDDEGTRTVETIFDPDVPNIGGKFPPGMYDLTQKARSKSK